MYLSFAWTAAWGGFNDYRNRFDDLEEAKDHIEQSDHLYGHVVFIGNETFRVVCTYDRNLDTKWAAHTPNLYQSS